MCRSGRTTPQEKQMANAKPKDRNESGMLGGWKRASLAGTRGPRGARYVMRSEEWVVIQILNIQHGIKFG